MKQSLIIIVFFLLSTATFSKPKEEKKYNETFRDQYHFSPEMNRMGSPIAVWYADSVYHLYYQYNPFNLMNGYINWGQATSTDLLHWQNQELAIVQPSTVSDSMRLTPWWGSVSSEGGKALAWFNRWDDAIYQAKSTDGLQWDNEVLTTGTEKLKQCEPYVFWYKPGRKWVMFAYDRAEKMMHILNAEDGVNWKETSSFNYTYGYPQVMQLPVDRKPDVTRWVLITEKGTYMLGDFDGETFSIKSAVKSLNRGKKIGGTIMVDDQKNNRVLVLSQLEYQQQADLPSNGLLTFPAEISLHEFTSGVELVQQPISEIEKLHLKGQHWEEEKVYPGLSNNLLRRMKGMEFHIKGEILNLNSDLFGFLIRSNKERKGFEISYNAKQAILTIMGVQVEYKIDDNKFEFELLIDRSSVEVYLDGGRYVISVPFSPSPESNRYELFTAGGEIMVKWLDIYEMKSIWSEK